MLRPIAMLATLGVAGASVQAASLRVAPTTLEIQSPDRTANLMLRNEGNAPVHVQVRVFRWTQANGRDVLDPTDMVAASPPAALLAAGQDYVVRVVRTAKADVSAEEAYRVLIDEIPDRRAASAGAVRMVVRNSIPIFFTNGKPQPRLTCRLAGVTLGCTNDGAGHVRLSDLSLVQGGHALATHPGLFGYVLGGATMSWPLLAGPAAKDGTVTLQAATQSGHIALPVSPGS